MLSCISKQIFVKKLLVVLFSFLCISCSAQILAPDTVCVGTPVDFSTPRWAVTYAWDFNAVSVVQPISPITTLFSGAPLNTPANGILNRDSGNYYFFAINYGPPEELLRFDFGNDIHNVPVVTNLGSLGMTGTDLDGVYIVKDSATNQWYGVLADYSQLGVLSFGTSLSNPPTCTIHSFPSPAMDWAHQITIKRYNGNWIAFLANRHTNMTRFDFGPSLTGTPVATVLPNVGTLSSPTNFTLYEQAGNWYMLITDLLANHIVRYNFGTSLLNNSPTGTSLGNPGGLLSLPRSINLLNDCQGHLIAHVGNEAGELTKLDFGGDITSAPTATDLGSTGISHISNSIPCSYADSFGFIIIDAIGNRLRFYNPLNFSTPTSINYYDPHDTFTFSTTGIYHVSLFCDMGYGTGPFVDCKDIVVVSGFGTFSSRDTSICSSPSLTLSAGVAGPHVWSTGDTTASITVTASGTYWVTTTTGPCSYKSDTIHVTTGLPVNLGNDTSFCIGHTLVLSPAVPVGSSFTWSTGSVASSISVSATGTYWVTVHSGACIGHDTIHVTVSPAPPVHLGPDTTLCAGTPITLHSSDTYTAPTYLWSTGSTSATIGTAITGAYWLRVTVAGCTGADTVAVTFSPTPIINLGNDTTFCAPDSLVLAPLIPGDAIYTWSTGALTPSITVITSGTYWIKINEGGCSATDTIHVVVLPKPIVNLGPDKNVCIDSVITLKSSVTYTAPTYLWSTGSTAAAISPGGTNAYWLAVTVAGCTGRDTVNITFVPNPVVNLGNDTAICDNATITLSAVEPAGIIYSWSTGSNAPSIDVSAAGVYRLTVTLNGCSATDSILVAGLSMPTLHLGPDTILCNGEILQLSAGVDTALWSNDKTAPNITVTEAGTYWASVHNICGTASDTVKVSYELCDLLFPSAFTPNDDGRNDIIRAIGHFKNFTDFSLSIYNRWGQRVFFTEDIYEGWDGKFHGVKQDMGTYFYMMNYSFEGKKHMLKGDIELIR